MSSKLIFFCSQTLFLMPVLWLVAFCMSYPQMHYKELITMSINKFVATETAIPVSDWIGRATFSRKDNYNLDFRILSCS